MASTPIRTADPAVTGATTGTEAHGGAHSAGFPPFRSDTFASQLIWFALAFGLLYVLMSKVALPRVAETLETRRRRIAQDLDEAQALRTQSEEAGAAYERSLAEARDKAKAIAQAARDQGAAESDAKRKSVEADLAAKLSASEATIRQRTDDAMSKVREIAVDTAGAIVERLTGRSADRNRIQAALDRTLQA